jgi:hypothetical protein
VTDVRLIAKAATQHRCISRAQLHALGYRDRAIEHRLETGRLVALHEAVFAVAPASGTDRERWMAATLTAPGSVLAFAAAGAAYGFWSPVPAVPIIVRPGSGGPRMLDGVLVCRSTKLRGDDTTLDGSPSTTAERAAVDRAAHAGPTRMARMVREAIRLEVTTAADLFVAITRHRGRRGTRRLYDVVSRYAGLPIARTRSDAEALALSILRDAGRPGPGVNVDIAGEEADLSWPTYGLIIELDGGQFHLDKTEDARRQAVWEAAGWRVERLPTDDVYLRPERLLALAPRRERP